MEQAETNFEQEKIQIERERLLIDKARMKLETKFLYRYAGAIIGAAISFAAVVVSSVQVWVTYTSEQSRLTLLDTQNKNESFLAQTDSDRRWNLLLADFLIKNRPLIFSENNEERVQVRNILAHTFPQRLTRVLFQNLELTVPQDKLNIWTEGRAILKELRPTYTAQLLAEHSLREIRIYRDVGGSFSRPDILLNSSIQEAELTQLLESLGPGTHRINIEGVESDEDIGNWNFKISIVETRGEREKDICTVVGGYQLNIRRGQCFLQGF